MDDCDLYNSDQDEDSEEIFDNQNSILKYKYDEDKPA